MPQVIISFFWAMLFFNCSFAQTPFPFASNYKWGYADSTGKTIIAARFDYATEIKHGHAVAKESGIWYIIDSTGKSFIKIDDCDYLKQVGKGIFAARKGNEFYLMNSKGEKMLDEMFAFISETENPNFCLVSVDYMQYFAEITNNENIILKKFACKFPKHLAGNYFLVHNLIYDAAKDVILDSCAEYKKLSSTLSYYRTSKNSDYIMINGRGNNKHYENEKYFQVVTENLMVIRSRERENFVEILNSENMDTDTIPNGLMEIFDNNNNAIIIRNCQKTWIYFWKKRIQSIESKGIEYRYKLILYRRHGKAGAIDFQGQEIIPNLYADILHFTHQYYWLIDTNGNGLLYDLRKNKIVHDNPVERFFMGDKFWKIYSIDKKMSLYEVDSTMQIHNSAHFPNIKIANTIKETVFNHNPFLKLNRNFSLYKLSYSAEKVKQLTAYTPADSMGYYFLKNKNKKRINNKIYSYIVYQNSSSLALCQIADSMNNYFYELWNTQDCKLIYGSSFIDIKDLLNPQIHSIRVAKAESTQPNFTLLEKNTWKIQNQYDYLSSAVISTRIGFTFDKKKYFSEIKFLYPENKFTKLYDPELESITYFNENYIPVDVGYVLWNMQIQKGPHQIENVVPYSQAEIRNCIQIRDSQCHFLTRKNEINIYAINQKQEGCLYANVELSEYLNYEKHRTMSLKKASTNNRKHTTANSFSVYGEPATQFLLTNPKYIGNLIIDNLINRKRVILTNGKTILIPYQTIVIRSYGNYVIIKKNSIFLVINSWGDTVLNNISNVVTNASGNSLYKKGKEHFLMNAETETIKSFSNIKKVLKALKHSFILLTDDGQAILDKEGILHPLNKEITILNEIADNIIYAKHKRLNKYYILNYNGDELFQKRNQINYKILDNYLLASSRNYVKSIHLCTQATKEYHRTNISSLNQKKPKSIKDSHFTFHPIFTDLYSLPSNKFTLPKIANNYVLKYNLTIQDIINKCIWDFSSIQSGSASVLLGLNGEPYLKVESTAKKFSKINDSVFRIIETVNNETKEICHKAGYSIIRQNFATVNYNKKLNHFITTENISNSIAIDNKIKNGQFQKTTYGYIEFNQGRTIHYDFFGNVIY